MGDDETLCLQETAGTHKNKAEEQAKKRRKRKKKFERSNAGNSVTLHVN